LDEQTLIIGARHHIEHLRVSDGGDIILHGHSGATYRFTFHDDAPIEIDQTAGYGNYRGGLDLSISPDNRYWLLSDYTVLDLRDFQIVALLQDGISEQYTVYMYWLDDGDLRVYTDGSSDRYRVRLP
jgi:hypothetical protein